MWIRRLLTPFAPPLCCSCGSHAGLLEPLCRECRARLRWLGSDPVAYASVELWAPLAYDGPARSVVHELKFRGRARVADAMAAQIAANAPPGLLSARSALVPVPLHSARLRRRGFNQAERLAAALAVRTGLRVHHCLVRRGENATQMGRTRGERLSAMDGLVAVRSGTPVPPRVLLVDDVATTGATIASCATALLAAGSTHVAALAYARTPGR